MNVDLLWRTLVAATTTLIIVMIQDSRFKIFIGITGQQVSFTNRQDNTPNINTQKNTKAYQMTETYIQILLRAPVKIDCTHNCYSSHLCISYSEWIDRYDSQGLMTDKSNHISEVIHMFHTTHLSRRVYTLYIYIYNTLLLIPVDNASLKYMPVFGDHFS